VKERELRAQVEKWPAEDAGRPRRGARRTECRGGTAISESQSDLGVHAASLEAVSSDRLQPGARIRVRGFSKPVLLRRIDGSSAEIEAGPLRMKVARDEITGVEGTAPAPKPSSPAAKLQSVTVTSQRGEAGTSDEINVIGMTVEEATDRLDKFLDDAALARKTRIRIIHGTDGRTS